VEGSPEATLSVAPVSVPIGTGRAPVSLVVVNYGNHHLAGNLLRSLANHPDRALIHEVVIVDNGYPEMGDSRATLSSLEMPFPIRFRQHHGHSYSESINLGATGCEGSVLLLSNNDVEWLPGASVAPAIEQLLQHPDIGVAGPQLLFPDGRWQRSAGPFPSLGEAFASLFFLGVLSNRVEAARFRRNGKAPKVEDVDYVDGACMAVSRKCFEALGGLDPAFDFYASDTDFSWRAKCAGWRRVLVPAARLMHVRGASSSAVRKRTYARRLFNAKRQLVERTSGQLSAAGYDLLQRAAAIEYALLYGLLDAVWKTPASQRRAAAARESGLAAMDRMSSTPT